MGETEMAGVNDHLECTELTVGQSPKNMKIKH